MSVPLFDVQTACGGVLPGQRERVTVKELKQEIERLDIGRALVRTGPEQLCYDFPLANARLYADCASDDALTPCPVMVPNTARDLASEEQQAAEALAQGAGAVCLRPGPDGWRPEPWGCGNLFNVLEKHRLPVLCPERLMPVPLIAELAVRYPAIPFILAEGGYRSFRIYLPLLEQRANVFLSLGNNFHVHKCIEHLVEAVGPERLLFGTGFPAAEPMCAITQLLYSDLPEKSKRLIGGDNLERLIGNIRS